MVTSYTLRLDQTVVSTQPEVEPNDTRTSGTPSSFTHEGTLSAPNDRDCFAFHGRAGDRILLAVDGDPEGDGSVADPVLELVGPSDAILDSADFTGLGGKEFLEYSAGLPSEGVYAYCVSSVTGGPGATFRAGIMRNGGLYLPAYKQGPTWLNPPPGNMALVSDTLSFRVAISNTSPLTLPGDITLYAGFPDACLDYVSASPAPTNVDPDEVTWLQTGLAPGAVFSATVDLQAVDTCSDNLHQSTSIAYFFTGTGGDVPFSVGRPVFLPAIRK